jgi:PAS domain S-box-containing protein
LADNPALISLLNQIHQRDASVAAQIDLTRIVNLSHGLQPEDRRHGRCLQDEYGCSLRLIVSSPSGWPCRSILRSWRQIGCYQCAEPHGRTPVVEPSLGGDVTDAELESSRSSSAAPLTDMAALGLPALAALVTGAPDAIVILDPEQCGPEPLSAGRPGRFVYANQAALELFGRSLEELRGRDFLSFFPAREQARYTDSPGPLGRPYRGTVCRPDGSEREVVLSRMDVDVAGRAHRVGYMRDVTAEHDAAHRAAAFAQTSAELVGTSSVEQIASAIARQAVEATSAAACVIVVADEDGKLVFVGSHGLPGTWPQAPAGGVLSFVDVPGGQTLLAGKPVVLPDAPAVYESNAATASFAEDMRSVNWQGQVYAPLSWRGDVFGRLVMYLPSGAHRPSEADLAFYTALADQAAVAVMNARLAAQAKQAAAALERTRLARDLHDSVSQALFSMTMQARAAQLSMPAAGVGADSRLGRSVARLLELTRGAQAEMRALIFELRPEALSEEGLVSALRKQAAGLSSREQIAITVQGPEERLALDADMEEHVYRIGVEALHNVVKHARGETASVVVTADAGALGLTVCDDGEGFDTAAEHGGHWGLSTMRERAEAIGAILNVTSTPGGGTTVAVSVPLGRAEQVKEPPGA